MKRNAIARIIIYSFIILILVSILLIGLGIGMFTYRVDNHTEAYALGSGTIPAYEVNDIEINWAAGSITIETADTDSISFSETGGKDSEPMVYRQQGNKLIIEYQVPKVVFGFSSSSSKDLVITIPQDWQGGKLTVNAASAELTVNGLTTNDISVNTASGDCTFTDCSLSELELNSASGKVNYIGTLYRLDCDTASGDITVVFDNIPKSIEFDGVSADLELTLPADAGFIVEMDALSGGFTSDFETSQRNGQYICGDGSCKIDIDGMSGNVTIRKG